MPLKRPRDSANSLELRSSSPSKRSRPNSPAPPNPPQTPYSWAEQILTVPVTAWRMARQYMTKEDTKRISDMRVRKSTAGKDPLPKGAGRSKPIDDGGGSLRTILDADELAKNKTASLSPILPTDVSTPTRPQPLTSPTVYPAFPYHSSSTPKGAWMENDGPPLFDEGSLAPFRLNSNPFRADPRGLISSQPIEINDTEDESSAGPSRSPTPQIEPSTLASDPQLNGRRAPQRPDFSGYTPKRRDYSWIPEEKLDTPKTSARSSPRSPATGRKSRRASQRAAKEKTLERQKEVLRNVIEAVEQSGKQSRVRRLNKYLKELEPRHVDSPARRHEGIYRIAVAQLGSTKSKQAYEDILLNRRKSQSFESKFSNPVPAHSTAKTIQRVDLTKSDIRNHRPSTIKDIISDFEKTAIAEEKELAKRLRPACPTTMSQTRSRTVSEHLGNRGFKARQVLSDHIRRLRPVEWLNDEIINTYGELLVERYQNAVKDGQVGDLKDVYFFNTFFYQKLSEQGYDKAMLSRWTKRGKGKADIFEKSAVIFPLNIGNMHWTAGCINIAQKRLEYYDSMGDRGRYRDEIFSNMREYLEKEHENKKSSPYDLSDWTEVFLKSSPQQSNGSDCGVFTCQTLDAIARGKDLSTRDGWDFSADNMPYLRNLMVLEIAQEKLEPRWPKETS